MLELKGPYLLKLKWVTTKTQENLENSSLAKVCPSIEIIGPLQFYSYSNASFTNPEARKQGDKGDLGETGAQGQTGETRPQGEEGPVGHEGEQEQEVSF